MGIIFLLVAVYLLMAVQMYENHVVVLAPVYVVLVEFLSVMDALSTERADMVLDAGDPLLTERKVFRFLCRPLCPVFPQIEVVGGGEFVPFTITCRRILNHANFNR
jgi:hypothetical protein